MKKILIVLSVFIVIGAISAGVLVSKVKRFQAYMDEIEIGDVDVSEISDGLYMGVSDSGVIKVKVEVEVREGKMTGIRLLEHKHGKGENAEVIIDDILKEQRITVDAIAGATFSSLVIQDSVQKALRGF